MHLLQALITKLIDGMRNCSIEYLRYCTPQNQSLWVQVPVNYVHTPIRKGDANLGVGRIRLRLRLFKVMQVVAH